MCKFTKFVTALGFTDVSVAPSKSHPKEIRAFTFGTVNPSMVHSVLGRSKRHDGKGRFAYLIGKERAVFVNVKRTRVVLCNGNAAVKAMLETFK